jgi:Major Facilitator Superfamily
MPEAATKAAARVPSLDLTPAPRRRRMALLAVCLGFFVIQLDATIVNVALPAIQRDVGGSLAGLPWIIDGYTLPLAAFMLTAGSAADRLGARRIFLAGLAAGPVLGGGQVTLVCWRLIFAVNVPACLVTAALVRRWVDESPRRPGSATDLAGLVLGVITLGSLAAGFIEAGQRGWLSAAALGLFAIAAAGAPAFVAAERRRAAPMLPLGLFASRAFSAATAVGVLFNLCFYGTLLCLSLFLQRSLGQSALRAGHPAADPGHRRRLDGERQAHRQVRATAADDLRDVLWRPGRGADQRYRTGRAAVADPDRLGHPRLLLAGHARHDGCVRRGGRPRARRAGQRRAQCRAPDRRGTGRRDAGRAAGRLRHRIRARHAGWPAAGGRGRLPAGHRGVLARHLAACIFGQLGKDRPAGGC